MVTMSIVMGLKSSAKDERIDVKSTVNEDKSKARIIEKGKPDQDLLGLDCGIQGAQSMLVVFRSN